MQLSGHSLENADKSSLAEVWFTPEHSPHKKKQNWHLRHLENWSLGLQVGRNS